MVTSKLSSYLVIACTITTVLLVLSFRSYGPAIPLRSLSIQPSSSAPLSKNSNFKSAYPKASLDTTSEIGRVSNSTLGFQKVFVLSLEERTDKRDAFVLGASLTGFGVEFIAGLKGDKLSEKARPPGLKLVDGSYGAWRTHMNAISRIIQDNLATAFIMEDDVDWDIRLLSQLPDFAKGVRSLSGISPSQTQYSPYGDDWDVLWPGHCGDYLPENDKRLYVIENDETVAPTAQQPWLTTLKDMPEHTRIVHKAGAPICTFGYAVSYRGAQKILMGLGVKGGQNMAFDNSLAFLCRDGYLDMKCYSVEPQLFHHHRPAGSVNKDSDINGGDSDIVREKGNTEVMIYSARLNLEQLITGSKEYTMQW
ncbi:glycosyltransferase family 25 protein [Rutstroemia sp. NJR-2017a WRK4]|nr:glycosyltransferase family 25 protein [Rutstroemia sp. NJR-2017a WRK4]